MNYQILNLTNLNSIVQRGTNNLQKTGYFVPTFNVFTNIGKTVFSLATAQAFFSHSEEGKK